MHLSHIKIIEMNLVNVRYTIRQGMHLTHVTIAKMCLVYVRYTIRSGLRQSLVRSTKNAFSVCHIHN